MGWVRTDDVAHMHPKFLALDDDAAVALWWRALGHCNHQRTGGFVATGALRLLSLAPRPAVLAAKLVKVGLWESTEGGFQFHDYDHYQGTREEVAEARATEARPVSEAKREAGRLGGLRSAEARRASRTQAAANQNEADWQAEPKQPPTNQQAPAEQPATKIEAGGEQNPSAGQAPGKLAIASDPDPLPGFPPRSDPDHTLHSAGGCEASPEAARAPDPLEAAPPVEPTMGPASLAEAIDLAVAEGIVAAEEKSQEKYKAAKGKLIAWCKAAGVALPRAELAALQFKGRVAAARAAKDAPPHDDEEARPDRAQVLAALRSSRLLVEVATTTAMGEKHALNALADEVDGIIAFQGKRLEHVLVAITEAARDLRLEASDTGPTKWAVAAKKVVTYCGNARPPRREPPAAPPADPPAPYRPAPGPRGQGKLESAESYAAYLKGFPS